MNFNIQKPLSLFSNSDLLNYLLSNNLQKFSSIVQKFSLNGYDLFYLNEKILKEDFHLTNFHDIHSILKQINILTESQLKILFYSNNKKILLKISKNFETQLGEIWPLISSIFNIDINNLILKDGNKKEFLSPTCNIVSMLIENPEKYSKIYVLNISEEDEYNLNNVDSKNNQNLYNNKNNYNNNNNNYYDNNFNNNNNQKNTIQTRNDYNNYNNNTGGNLLKKNYSNIENNKLMNNFTSSNFDYNNNNNNSNKQFSSTFDNIKNNKNQTIYSQRYNNRDYTPNKESNKINTYHSHNNSNLRNNHNNDNNKGNYTDIVNNYYKESENNNNNINNEINYNTRYKSEKRIYRQNKNIETPIQNINNNNNNIGFENTSNNFDNNSNNNLMISNNNNNNDGYDIDDELKFKPSYNLNKNYNNNNNNNNYRQQKDSKQISSILSQNRIYNEDFSN